MHSSRHRFTLIYLVMAGLLVLSLVPLAEAQNRAASQNAKPADTLNQLLSGQGRALLAKPVTLSNVAVQRITQDDIVWVGTNPNSSVLVMLQPSVNPIDAQGNPTPVSPGDVARVTAHVIPAPSAQVLESWGVAPADAARVQQQGVVLQAVVVEVTRRNK